MVTSCMGSKKSKIIFRKCLHGTVLGHILTVCTIPRVMLEGGDTDVWVLLTTPYQFGIEKLGCEVLARRGILRNPKNPPWI